MQRGLGKGLEGLFEDNCLEEEAEEKEFLKIKTADIEPDRAQPRKTFSKDSIEELAASIAEHGILQPITVRKTSNGRYKIISGERRWRAARAAGLKEIPAILKSDIDDLKAFELGLIENLQREDLNIVEEAKGYKTLIETFSLTQDQAAERVGKSRSAVANSMRILALPEEVLDLVLNGEISSGHARALLPLMNKFPDKKAFIEEVKNIIKKGLTVRQTEDLAKQNRRSRKKQTKENIYYAEISENLTSAWGRKIYIRPESKKNGEKGKIVIEYYNGDDFNDLTKQLLGRTK